MSQLISRIEEALYEQVAGEIARGDIRQGLWLKATVESDGSDHMTKVLYTKFRIAQIVAGATIDAERDALIDRLVLKNYAVEEKKDGAWVLFEPNGNCRRFESFAALSSYATTLVPAVDRALTR